MKSDRILHETMYKVHVFIVLIHETVYFSLTRPRLRLHGLMFRSPGTMFSPVAIEFQCSGNLILTFLSWFVWVDDTTISLWLWLNHMGFSLSWKVQLIMCNEIAMEAYNRGVWRVFLRIVWRLVGPECKLWYLTKL